MCFPGGGTHIPCDMLSPTWETHIPSDMCSPTWKTHIPSDMPSPTCIPKGLTMDLVQNWLFFKLF